jgi:AcrR family transcriptional regulator
LPRTLVVQNQRKRIFDALAAVCVLKGYPAVTVEDVTARAGVSRRTFYDLFADKESCFLAAYDQSSERLLEDAQAAYAAGPVKWPERIAAALRAVVERLCADPALARLVIVEVLTAGRRAHQHRDASLLRFRVFFEAGREALPAGMRGQDLLAQAVIGGLYETIYGYVRDGHVDELPEVMPTLLYCALVPYLGHATAMAARRETGPAATE